MDHLTIHQFERFCDNLLTERKINTKVTHDKGNVRIEIPGTNPKQVFVCNTKYWHIETFEKFVGYRITVHSTEYSSKLELESAIDNYFKKSVAMSQFNPTDAQLWMALDKLTDVVHSLL